MPPVQTFLTSTDAKAAVVRSVEDISGLSVLDSVALFLPTMVAASIALLRRTTPNVRRHRYSRHHVVAFCVFMWISAVTLLALFLRSPIDSARVILLLPINLFNYGILGTLDVICLLLPMLIPSRSSIRRRDILSQRVHVPFGRTLSGTNMPGLPQWNMMYTSKPSIRIPLAIAFTLIVLSVNTTFAYLMFNRKEFVPLVALVVGLVLTVTNTHPKIDRTIDTVEQTKQHTAIHDSPDGAIIHSLTHGERTRAFLLGFREQKRTFFNRKAPQPGTNPVNVSDRSSATPSSTATAATSKKKEEGSQEHEVNNNGNTYERCSESTVALFMFADASSKLSHAMQWDRRSDETEVERFNRLFPVSAHGNTLDDDGSGLDTTARSLTAFLKGRYGGSEWADGHMDETIRKHILSGDALRAVAFATSGVDSMGKKQNRGEAVDIHESMQTEHDRNGTKDKNSSNNNIAAGEDEGDELTWLTSSDKQGQIDLFGLFVLMHVHAMVEQRINVVLSSRENNRKNKKDNGTATNDEPTANLMTRGHGDSNDNGDDNDEDALPYFVAAMEPKYYGANRRTHGWQTDYKGAARDWKLSDSRIQKPDCRRELAVVGTTPEAFFKCNNEQETEHMIGLYERMANGADSTWVRLYACCLYLIRQKRVAAVRLKWKGGETEHLLHRVEDPISMNGQLESLLITQLAYSAVIAVKAWLPGRGELSV